MATAATNRPEESSRDIQREGTENSSQSHPEAQNFVLQDGLSDMSFDNTLVCVERADDNLHTAKPCPICKNFTTHVTDLDLQKAESLATAGCLGCRLIMCAQSRYVQENGHKPSKALYMGIFDDTMRIDIGWRNIVVRSGALFPPVYEIFTPTTVRQLPEHITIRRPISINSGSLESFNRISEWLQACRKHPTCQLVDNQLPNRILDIDCPEGIKLQSNKNLKGMYCALSHCWGSAEHAPEMTKKDTLLSRLTKIDEHALSKTFRDAITLARYLSIKYLWIDSLCIVQDDKEDWDQESAKMASIYQNAYLVIAATHAKHGEVGCFSDRSGPTFCYNISHIDGEQIPVYLGDEQNHGHFHPSSMYTSSPSYRYPLLSRAWCLQERLLATRLIHFAGEELVWECRARTVCECEALDEDDDSWSFKKRWATDLDSSRLFDLWHKTVQMYTMLHITFASDRLPAMSGLAKLLQSRSCGEYIAGMWVQNIFADLMWSCFTQVTRPEEWRAPSWSWACADFCSVTFATTQDNSPQLPIHTQSSLGFQKPLSYLGLTGGENLKTALVSIDYTLAGTDTTGSLKRAILSISTPVINGLLLVPDNRGYDLKKGPEIVKLRNYKGRIDSADDFASQENPVLCIWIGTIWSYDQPRLQVLILQPSRGLGKDPEPGCYERVGALSAEIEYGGILAKWFADSKVETVKIV